MSSPYPHQPGFGQQPFGQQPGFPQQAYGPAPPPQSGGGCGCGIVVGCLGVVLIVMVLCGGGVWWASRNVERLVAMGVRQVIVALVNDSDLPQQEKTEVITQIDRVVDAFAEKKISQAELQQIGEELQKSPVFVVIGAWGLEKIFIEPSGLSDDEKQAAKRTLSRAMRGVMEKKISEQQFTGALPQTDQAGALGKPPRPRPGNRQVTDAEVRKMIADLKQLADDAGIPDEEIAIDIGDEVKKVVDKALEGKGAP
jgi:hypothetical protein